MEYQPLHLNDIFDSNLCRLYLMSFEELCHCAALLLGDSLIFLLDHPQTRNGKLELDLEFGLMHEISD